MGIDTRWKKILKEVFGIYGGFYDELPDDVQIDKIIDDMSLNMRSVILGISNWQEAASRARGRIQKMWSPTLKEYCILFDERDFVPLSKQQTQMSRTEDERHPPFTEEELKYIRIGEGEIPDDKRVFISRLMATRGLHGDLYDFIGSEIASIDMKGKTLRITIDGGFERRILMKNDKIQVVNQYKHSYEEGELKDFDTRSKYIFVTTQPEEGKRSQAFIVESARIGESDLKIPKHIDETEPKKNIYIRSKDTDSIPIILLHMRDWMNRDTGVIKFGIYLDLSPIEGDRSLAMVIDMVHLWRSIMVYFGKYFPHIPCPIETVVMLMLFNGCDYCNSYNRLVPQVIWDSFVRGGYAILFEREEERIIRDNSESSTENIAPVNSIIMDMAWGDTDTNKRHSVTLAEHKLYEFLAYTYYNTVIGHEPVMSKIKDMSTVRQVASAKDETRKREHDKWKIPPDEEIQVNIRTMYWTLDYWINGNKRIPFMDPIALERNTLLSKHGWERDKDGVIRRAKRIHSYRKRVHTQSSIPSPRMNDEFW